MTDKEIKEHLVNTWENDPDNLEAEEAKYDYEMVLHPIIFYDGRDVEEKDKKPSTTAAPAFCKRVPLPCKEVVL